MIHVDADGVIKLCDDGIRFDEECCSCAYEASDNNTYGLDTFDTYDAGWSDVAGGLWDFRVDGGYMIAEFLGGFGGDGVNTQQTTLASVDGLKIIQEVVIYKLNDSTHWTGIRLDRTTGVFLVYLRASWTTNNYRFGYYLDTVAVNQNAEIAPADGDKLTIKLEETSADYYRACFFVNEVLIGEITNEYPVTFPTTIQHGLWTIANSLVPTDYGKWDDYTLHVSNW